MAEWNQHLTHAHGMYVTILTNYTKRVVGNLTDADFAHPSVDGVCKPLCKQEESREILEGAAAHGLAEA